jgi:hypothetical protein
MAGQDAFTIAKLNLARSRDVFGKRNFHGVSNAICASNCKQNV